MNHFNEETNRNLFTVQAENLSEELLISQPLLPRSSWKDKQAFFREIIKAKQALEIAEITAILWE